MNNLHADQKKRSFTLVEMLVVMSLAVVIIIGGYAIYIISLKTYQKNTAQGELAQNARIALERMTRDIRQTMDIVTALGVDQQHFSPEIEFQNGHLTTPIQYIDFKLVGSDLEFTPVHYAFNPLDPPDMWVRHDELINGILPQRITGLPEIKAQKITALEFWGIIPVVNINLTVSDDTTSYQFATTSFGRNL